MLTEDRAARSTGLMMNQTTGKWTGIANTLKNCKAETARHALSMKDGNLHPDDGKLKASRKNTVKT